MKDKYYVKWKKPDVKDCMLPFIWHSGKEKSIVEDWRSETGSWDKRKVSQILVKLFNHVCLQTLWGKKALHSQSKVLLLWQISGLNSVYLLKLKSITEGATPESLKMISSVVIVSAVKEKCCFRLHFSFYIHVEYRAARRANQSNEKGEGKRGP